MTGAGSIAGDHRSNDLRETSLQIVSLDDERRAKFAGAQIGIREQHKDNVTAPVGWL